MFKVNVFHFIGIKIQIGCSIKANELISNFCTSYFHNISLQVVVISVRIKTMILTYKFHFTERKRIFNAYKISSSSKPSPRSSAAIFSFAFIAAAKNAIKFLSPQLLLKHTICDQNQFLITHFLTKVYTGYRKEMSHNKTSLFKCQTIRSKY